MSNHLIADVIYVCTFFMAPLGQIKFCHLLNSHLNETCHLWYTVGKMCAKPGARDC